MTLDTYRASRFDVMQVAKNVHAPLVSTFLDGRPQGMVAEDWQVDGTGRTWRFRIRRGLTFDDGTPITPEVVVRSIRRMLWLTRKDGLALNELLPESAAWSGYEAPLGCLYADGDAVVFHFSKRPRNLFQIIGQPIYGIVHPKCFDGDGRWKEPFCTATSGQYAITERSSDTIVLRSRHVYPEVDDAPDIVEIHTPSGATGERSNPVTDGRADLVIEPGFAVSRRTKTQLRSMGWSVVEEPGVEMYFVQLNGRRRPFDDGALRRSIRDAFLDALRRDPRFLSEDGVNPSFIPKGGVGHRTFRVPVRPRVRKAGAREVAVVLYPLGSYPFPADRGAQEAVEDSLLRVLRSHGLTPRVERFTERSEPLRRMEEGDFDAMLRWTGILVHDPYADLRMMLMSRVGALIPDHAGFFPRLIAQAEASADPMERQRLIERINASIFEEASIITFTHSGFVFMHRPGVDLSRHDPFADPMEFRAVIWRPTGLDSPNLHLIPG
ncbi:MAG: ABC transporter substrate-binding protein [Elusimicrobiota bacterium]